MNPEKWMWVLGTIAVLCIVGAITAALVGSSKYESNEDEHREGGI